MTSSRTRRRRALAHACPSCRRPWALRAELEGPALVIACRYCAAVRWTPSAVPAGARTSRCRGA